MRLHQTFEWDAAKAARNAAKHGVSFQDAAMALADEHADLFHLEMKDTSRNKRRPQIIRRGAQGLGQRSEKAMADLRRRATSDSMPTNTSDIPEQQPADGSWVRGGHLVGGIRGAIIGEMQRQGLTRYQLWKKARMICPKLPSSAVYEYLDGRRQAGGTYIEALLNALGLEVKPKATA